MSVLPSAVAAACKTRNDSGAVTNRSINSKRRGSGGGTGNSARIMFTTVSNITNVTGDSDWNGRTGVGSAR